MVVPYENMISPCNKIYLWEILLWDKSLLWEFLLWEHVYYGSMQYINFTAPWGVRGDPEGVID